MITRAPLVAPDAPAFADSVEECIASADGWLRDRRRAAWDAFSTMPAPSSQRDEDWRWPPRPADAVVEAAMADSPGPPVSKHGLQAQRSPVHPPSSGLRRVMDLRPCSTRGEDFGAAVEARARHGIDVHGEARFVASLLPAPQVQDRDRVGGAWSTSVTSVM